MRESRYVTGSFKLMNEVNIRLILDAIRCSGQISRAELARKIRLVPATVGNIVSELLDQDLINEKVETLNGIKSVGRPGRILELNDIARLVLAIDMEPEKLRISLVGLSSQVLAYSEISISRFAKSAAILSQMINGCNNLLSANPIWQDKLTGIGVSLPGNIDVEKGISSGSTNMPNWNKVPIVKHLEDAFRKPVRIARSMHACALSEKWRRPDVKELNVLFLVLRTGIGVSQLIKGELFYGARHFDGEIGHITVFPDGKECECGKRGCLETLISSSSVQAEAIAMIKSGQAQKLKDIVDGDLDLVTPETVYRLAKEGDVPCEHIVRRVMRHLGNAAANLVQILNPNEVVICGSIDLAEEIILDEIDKTFDKMLLPAIRRDVTVSLSPYKEKAALHGAAVMVLDEIFSLPNMRFSTYGKPAKTIEQRDITDKRKHSGSA
jgi:predicted NBD/HSP70 family sugar kinase